MTHAEAVREWNALRDDVDQRRHRRHATSVGASCQGAMRPGRACPDCGYARERDVPADRQSWVEFIDHLERSGRATPEQVSRWDQPAVNKGDGRHP